MMMMMNMTSGGQTTHCPGKIFYTVLRVPNQYVFTEFERNLRDRDFLLNVNIELRSDLI